MRTKKIFSARFRGMIPVLLIAGSVWYFGCERTGQVPEVSTVSVSGIGYTSCTVTGSITATGDGTIERHGFCWSASPSPTIDDFSSDLGPPAMNGEFSETLLALTPNTHYYIRAYAGDKNGEYYGTQLEFTTLNFDLPVVTTSDPLDITDSSATVGGRVFTTGGEVISERGIWYSTTANAESTGSKLIIGEGTGEFSASLTGLSPATTYYVKAFGTGSSGTGYGSEETFTTVPDVFPPTVQTVAATDITNSSALAGGNVTGDGGAEVTGRGLFYGQNRNPEISGTKVESGSGTGEYSVELTTLLAGTKYYIRAYAENSQGIAYGDELSFSTEANSGVLTDPRDNQTYPWTRYGNQVWMTKNLAWLPSVSGPSVLSETTAQYYVNGYIGSDVAAARQSPSYPVYGALYNWTAALQACPEGWHLPSDGEWKDLEAYLGMPEGEKDATGWRSTGVGGKLKEAGTSHWKTPNTGATNESGFTALPGASLPTGGAFEKVGDTGNWWTSTSSTDPTSWKRSLAADQAGIERSAENRAVGYSVRCVKD